ncbi:DUF6544 family protein [Bacillus changyiensis]|uniref:DUF6544 family protein n=1 Tax=Bacillus changyiensis TaxID=3004103 RepID=UPI0022E158AD|nr:DUF6544 family protein [Bacillus changyiensis]MDA1475825.1 hypothetical protein [Bacillus changyiensis]
MIQGLALGLIIMMILVFFVSRISNIIFLKKVKQEAQTLFARNIDKDSKQHIIEKADLTTLPACVQKWLHHAQVIGKEKIHTVRIEQKSKLRLEKGKPWMPAKAVYYYTIDKPAFIWNCFIKAAPLIHIAGRDKYDQGKGNMLIKLLSFIKIADASGKEIDQGTLLRYLGELVWFPTAALHHALKWEEIDSHSAKATMSYGGITGSGVFQFNDKGEVTSFLADRYMESKGTYSLEKWLIQLKDYQEFNGIKIPVRGKVIWKLDTGDFDWFHFEIDDVQYNKIEID